MESGNPTEREKRLIDEIRRLREELRDITGRAPSVEVPDAAEQRLGETDDFFREAFAHAPVGMAITDLEGHFLEVNDAYCRMVGHSEQELLRPGFTFKELTHPDDLEQNLQQWRRLLSGEIPAFFFEKRYLHKDGRILWVRASVTSRRNQQGDPFKIVAIIEDISRQKYSEQSLQESREKFRKIFDSNPNMITVSTFAEGRILDVNQAFEKVTGYARAEVAGKNSLDLKFWRRKPDRERLRDLLSAQDGFRDEEVEIITRFGEPKILSLSADSIEIEGKKCVIATARDITERRRSEEELRRAYALIEAITTGTEDLIAASDARYRFLYFNEAYRREFRKLWGTDIHTGKSLLEAMAPWPEEQHKTRELWSRALSGESFSITMEFGPSEREKQVYDLRFNPIYAAGGRQIGAAHILRNVTEEVRIQKTLRRNAEIDAYRIKLTDALRKLDDPRKIQFASACLLGNFLQADRVHYAEVIENGEYGLVHEDFHKEVPSVAGRHRFDDYGRTVMDEFRAGRTLIVENLAEDPRLSPAERAVTAKLDVGAYVLVPLIRGGRPIAVFVVHQAVARAWSDSEITLIEETAERTWTAVERARAERGIRAAKEAAEEANRAKSEFLANMSHEIRTPLTVTLTALELLESSRLDPEQARLLEMAATSSRTLHALIDDILDFSKIEARKMELQPRPVDLRLCLEKAVAMFSLEAGRKGLEIAMEIGPGTPAIVLMDADRVHQVLTNLISNAVKFTEKGRVTVCVVMRNEVLRFTVRDTGIGIPPDQTDRLFESFTQADSSLTRKYGGTGLGLAICKGLVELMGGEIRATSREGEGSEFCFTIPIAEPKSSPPPGSPPD